MILSEPPSFCDCTGEDSCNCGEITHTPCWGWSQIEKTDSAHVSEDKQEVYFHHGYSKGTASVRGDTPFLNDNHYFWELKVTRPVYGTSVMIGVGTSEVILKKHQNQFNHLLGEDGESWGLTFNGMLFHQGVFSIYDVSACFDKGTILGVHLDMWNGTLEFFMNRRPLGIAFSKLRNKILYPMVSSTAANSCMKLIYSTIRPHSLQYLTTRKLTEDQRETLPPGLKKVFSSWWWNFPKQPKRETKGKGTIGLVYPKTIYVLFDSEDEDADENDRLMAVRMKRVIENSAGPGVEVESEPNHIALRQLPKRARLLSCQTCPLAIPERSPQCSKF